MINSNWKKQLFAPKEIIKDKKKYQKQSQKNKNYRIFLTDILQTQIKESIEIIFKNKKNKF